MSYRVQPLTSAQMVRAAMQRASRRIQRRPYPVRRVGAPLSLAGGMFVLLRKTLSGS